MPVLSNGTCLMELTGGEQKHALKNCTPLAQGTIKPSVNNVFPTRSGKRLQLECWISTVGSFVYKTAGK